MLRALKGESEGAATAYKGMTPEEINQLSESLVEEGNHSEMEEDVEWQSLERTRLLSILGEEMVMNMLLISGSGANGPAAMKVIQMLSGDGDKSNSKSRGASRTSARSNTTHWRSDFQLKKVQWLVDLSKLGTQCDGLVTNMMTMQNSPT